MKDIQLDNYQVGAINRLRTGCILCGGVGSGKSRTALGYFFKEQGGRFAPFSPMKNPKDLYIITTARKRDTLEWEEELAPYSLSIDPSKSKYKNKIVVDSWNNIKKYTEITDSFFIFDEQRLVGSGAWVKAFYKIADKNAWILLTATPGDTWSDYIPVFVANGFYRNKTEFLRRHAVYSYYSKYPKVVKYLDQGRLIKFRKSILVDMDYKKKTVHHEETVLVDYDVLKYQQVNKMRWNPYTNRPVKNISELCFCLRKIVNSDESRAKSVLDICEVHEKLIIFYSFDYELDILKNLPYIKGTKVAEWNGHIHQPIPKSDRWVYLVNYAAGAEGWNCIETDTILFYSQHYSYRTMLQASGRIDRRNTPFSDLFYYTMRSNAPIDMAIAYALKKKKTFNETSFFF